MSKPPLTIDWHVTQRCNLTCRHCYAAGEYFQGESQETTRIIDTLLDLGDNFTLQVTLTGGEPLLREDVFDIASRLSEHAIPVSLTTNGLLVRKTLDSIVQSGIGYLQVSIDGTRELHDALRGKSSFDAALDALELLTREDLFASVMTTVNRLNVNQVPEIIDIVHRMNIPLLGLQRCIPTGRGREFRDAALAPTAWRDVLNYVIAKKEELKDELSIMTPDPLMILVDKQQTAGCCIGRNILALTPNGDMLPCCKLPIRLGSILSRDFPDAWNSRIMNTLRDGSHLRGKCGKCPYREACRGCRAASYAASSDCLGEDPQCWLELPPP